MDGVVWTFLSSAVISIDERKDAVDNDEKTDNKRLTGKITG
jgi:hypothetical protein